MCHIAEPGTRQVWYAFLYNTNLILMKLAIIGSRGFADYALLSATLAAWPVPLTAIVSGGAAGADELAARFGAEHGVPLEIFLPDYARYGRLAPIQRNGLIISASDQVLAFWDSHSRGTQHALRLAKRLGKPCHVVEYDR